MITRSFSVNLSKTGFAQPTKETPGESNASAAGSPSKGQSRTASAQNSASRKETFGSFRTAYPGTRRFPRRVPPIRKAEGGLPGSRLRLGGDSLRSPCLGISLSGQARLGEGLGVSLRSAALGGREALLSLNRVVIPKGMILQPADAPQRTFGPRPGPACPSARSGAGKATGGNPACRFGW